MSALAVFFVAIGITDICRRITDRRWLTLGCGPVIAVVCALLAGLWHAGDLVPGGRRRWLVWSVAGCPGSD